MNSPSLRTESLLKLAWPIFLQNSTSAAVVFVDFIFLSHLGDDVAGTVGQLMPVFWMGAFVIPVFAGTGISVASQYMGAGRKEKVVPTYMMNLTFTAVMGLVYAALLGLFAGDIGRWMGMEGALNAIGSDYLIAIAPYFLFMGVLVAYNAILSSCGMTHWLMYTSFLVAGINLALNSLFVLGFGWGVQGIALASVAGVAAAMTVAMRMVHWRLGVRFYIKGAWKDMLGVLRPMMRIGIPNALEPFSYAVQQAILSTFIISLGVASMAANNYAGRAHMFQITFGFSLANAAQILLAHWMGARRFDDVNRLFWRTILAGSGVAFVYSVLLWWFADYAMRIFTDDPAITVLAGQLLLISLVTEPARSINIIGGFALRTVGDSRFPLVIGMLFIWGILPVIFALDHYWHLSLVAIWGCFAADEAVRACINLWRWKTGKWKSMGLAND